MSKIGPHSRPGVLAVIDGRRAEAKLMQRLKADLAKHVGGNPSVVQQMLIDQAAMLTLRVHLMDKASIADPELACAAEGNRKEKMGWTAPTASMCQSAGCQNLQQGSRPP